MNERKRERERDGTCTRILDTPKKEISTIITLVIDILLQVDLFPMKVAALSPVCYMSTEPR